MIHVFLQDDHVFFTWISPRRYMYFFKMIPVFLQDNTCISLRRYMYISRMIHGFVTIAFTISVGSCLPWAVIELAVRPTCSQNLEDVEVTLQFFFHCTFVSTLLCNNANMHNTAQCRATSFTFLHTLQQIAINTSLIVLSNLFSSNEDWKKSNRVQFTRHHLHHLYRAPGAWCIVLPMLSRVLAAVSISTRKLASSNKICWALCIL